MTDNKYLRGIVAAGTFFLLLGGCAGGPIKHPNLYKAKEHLSEAQELLSQNHPLQAIESVKEALNRHRLANDFRATIEDMNRLAHLYSIAGNVENAYLWIRKAKVLESVSNHPVLNIETLLLGAETAIPQKQSFPWLAEASKEIARLPPGETQEKDRLTARYEQVMGLSLSDQKEYSKAIDAFTKALSLDRKRKDTLSVATDLANLGRNLYLLKHYDEALRSFRDAYAIDLERHNSAGEAFDLEGISLVQAQKGLYKDAARSMIEASGIQMGLGRSEAAKKDISFVQSVISRLDGSGASSSLEALRHWFDDE
jgi:tetratricopeptide (TPR) repeat protein